MSHIIVEDVRKVFKIQKRKAGFINSCKSLFQRQFEYKTAVNDISFVIEKGEIIGYIGPNGAGKSTTIKMLCGILTPTQGTITVKGIVPHKNRVYNARTIGVVFGQRTQLWWDIPVIESINVMKYMYNIPENEFSYNLELYRKLLDLDEFINIPVRQLSLGQRIRADICCALLHNPDILYLDEPTIGLDVVAKKRIRDFITEINKSREVTVVLTTHDIADIEALCTRVIVIDKGRLMFNGNLNQLKDAYSLNAKIVFKLQEHTIIEERTLVKKFSKGINAIKVFNNAVTIDYNKSEINHVEITREIINMFNIADIIYDTDNLEDIIRELYETKNY